RPGALAVGDRLRDRLRTQLGIAPAPQTRALIARVREDAPDHAAPDAAPPDAERSGLVGREAELAMLRAAWTRVVAGQGLVLALSGEGGIGKTRMAGELLAHASAGGARTAVCASMELG